MLDLLLTRDALQSSTLNHGLKVLGDRWTVAVVMGAFTGFTRFEDWQTRLDIPRSTLAQRLSSWSRWACCASEFTKSARSAMPTT